MSKEFVWQAAILNIENRVKDAILNLDETSLRIVLIVDSENLFVGTITDGDIRRSLLKGGTLDSPITPIINREAVVIEPGKPNAVAKAIMIERKIAQLPIVDSSRRIHGLITWHDVESMKFVENPIVIMAGGKGTRLHPETENCPKPMLLVAGKPILEHIILKANSEGFINFILSIHYLGEVIENYFGNGSKFGVNITYLRESVPLGTAGALSLMDPMPNVPFIVTNGDVLSEVKFTGILDFHIKNSAFATMGIQIHEWQVPFGVVETEGIAITGYSEKPSYKIFINAGVYVIDPDFKSVLGPQHSYDMPFLFSKLADQSKNVVAYPIFESWMDIGIPVELAKARRIIG